jgi:hypothetical protein
VPSRPREASQLACARCERFRVLLGPLRRIGQSIIYSSRLIGRFGNCARICADCLRVFRDRIERGDRLTVRPCRCARSASPSSSWCSDSSRGDSLRSGRTRRQRTRNGRAVGRRTSSPRCIARASTDRSSEWADWCQPRSSLSPPGSSGRRNRSASTGAFGFHPCACHHFSRRSSRGALATQPR